MYIKKSQNGDLSAKVRTQLATKQEVALNEDQSVEMEESSTPSEVKIQAERRNEKRKVTKWTDVQ